MGSRAHCRDRRRCVFYYFPLAVTFISVTGAQMARLVSYLIEHFGNVQAMEFLRFVSPTLEMG